MSEPNGSYLSLFTVENSIIVSVPCGSELARDIRRNREQARSHKTIRVHHQKSLSKCNSAQGRTRHGLSRLPECARVHERSLQIAYANGAVANAQFALVAAHMASAI